MSFKLKLSLSILLQMAPLCGLAQGVDSLYLEARGSFRAQTDQGVYSSRLQAEYLNVQMFGHITESLSYRVRQRLNVGIDEKNLFRATDWMCLKWQATPRLSLSAGKTAILIGGYEYDAAPIDVYYYSHFCDNLSQCFAFSVNTSYEFIPGQNLTFQIANSPLSVGFQDAYSYNLAWQGSFAPWWEAIWSVNFVEDMDKNLINYVALGNHCLFGNVAVDVDLLNRAAASQRQKLFSDFSVIGKVIWSVGKWNICTKVGYEENDIANVDASGRAYDSVITPGTEYFYGGFGFEYFPLGSDKIRLHIAYFRDNSLHINNISAGLKWRFDAIRKK